MQFESTQENLTYLSLKFNKLSQLLEIFNICLNCKSIEFIELKYETKDAPDELLINSKVMFLKKKGFITHLIITQESHKQNFD